MWKTAILSGIGGTLPSLSHIATSFSTQPNQPPHGLVQPSQSDARRRCASSRFFSTRRPLWIATSGGTSVVTSARYAITPDAAYAEALPIRLDWLAGCPRLSCWLRAERFPVG
jgi:hypothetical protein